MFPYHNRLRQLLESEDYYVIDGKLPFSYRFCFPRISKSMPIREYRNKQYKKYLEAKGIILEV